MVSKTENKFQPSKQEIFGSFKNFKLLITASSNSGKSYLIKTLLTDKSFGLSNRFPADQVYIFDPTIELDDSYTQIIQNLEKNSTEEHQFNYDTQVFTKDLEQSLSTIYDQLKEASIENKKSGVEMQQSLVILDDCLLEINFGGNSQVSRMLVRLRHYNISFLLVSQYLKSLHPLSRAQFTHYITFNTSNKKEVEKIRDECASTLKNKEFYDLYHFCVDQPYGFLLVILNWPQKYKFFKGNGSEIQQLQI